MDTSVCLHRVPVRVVVVGGARENMARRETDGFEGRERVHTVPQACMRCLCSLLVLYACGFI